MPFTLSPTLGWGQIQPPLAGIFDSSHGIKDMFLGFFLWKVRVAGS